MNMRFLDCDPTVYGGHIDVYVMSEELETEFEAAIHGKSLPDSVEDIFTRSCVIRGIRLHHDFAVSQAVEELCSRGQYPQITRARNARLIMSNIIPEMEEDNYPYCIWYPDFATEETYRQLVARYPSMCYHVGRACAAAGYDTLYFELNVLPEVSIAEEARESGKDGGQQIFKHIMSAPFRYAIMDDYTLSVNVASPRFPALLNGDTDVRWRLESRLLYTRFFKFAQGGRLALDIEEDLRMGIEDSENASHKYLTSSEIQLLYEPIIGDLPTVKKDLLIQVAAYDGNIDRYNRLRRPVMTRKEHICVIRGIYHHSMFARWWAQQIDENTDYIKRLFPNFLFPIKRAISARRIMINDTQEFHTTWKPSHDPPYLIWWPIQPLEETLEALADRVPKTREQVMMAAIYMNSERVFKHVVADVEPNEYLWYAALKSPNPLYKQHLQEKANALNMEIQEPLFAGYQEQEWYVKGDYEPTEMKYFTKIEDGVQVEDMLGWAYGAGGGIYDMAAIRMWLVDKRVWSSPELVRRLDYYANGEASGETSVMDRDDLVVNE